MDNHVMARSTEDSDQYIFYPVTSGSVQFQVKTAHDARVCLAAEANENGDTIEVNFGGWKNTISAIRKCKTMPCHLEVPSPDIVSNDKFRGFWVRWGNGIIRAGLEGKTCALLTWEDPKPFPIAFIGVGTGYGSTGIWKVEGMPEINTPGELTYQFQPVLAGSVELQFRGSREAHVALTPGPAVAENMYEVLLGDLSAINYKKTKPNKVEVKTPELLQTDQFKKFVIEWRSGLVKVRNEIDKVFMEWQDPTPFSVTHFGLRTPRGTTGEWRIPTISTQTPSSSE